MQSGLGIKVIRFLVLWIIGTIGCALTVMGGALYYRIAVVGETINMALNTAIFGVSFPVAFFQIGVVGGTFGLGYLHVALVYLLFLRRIPNFWNHLPYYCGVLLLSTLIPLVLINAQADLFLIPMLFSPIGLWLTSAVLYVVANRNPQRAIT